MSVSKSLPPVLGLSDTTKLLKRGRRRQDVAYEAAAPDQIGLADLMADIESIVTRCAYPDRAMGAAALTVLQDGFTPAEACRMFGIHRDNLYQLLAAVRLRLRLAGYTPSAARLRNPSRGAV